MSSKEPSSAMIVGYCIKSSQKRLLLGVTVDNKLKFDYHINYLCKKARQKVNASARIAPFIDMNKKGL